MQFEPPYFKESCFANIDKYIKRATDAGVWVILTGRSQIGAGQNWQSKPQENFFHNDDLANRFYTAWNHVVQRYKSWDRIAAYEVLSEPRDQGVTPKQVQSFYYKACVGIH